MCFTMNPIEKILLTHFKLFPSKAALMLRNTVAFYGQTGEKNSILLNLIKLTCIVILLVLCWFNPKVELLEGMRGRGGGGTVAQDHVLCVGLCCGLNTKAEVKRHIACPQPGEEDKHPLPLRSLWCHLDILLVQAYRQFKLQPKGSQILELGTHFLECQPAGPHQQ